MQKRAIVLILVIFLLLIVLGGVVYYIYNNYQENEPLKEVKDIEFFIKPIDQKTKQDISINFMLFEGQVIKECLNEDSFELYKTNQTKFSEEFEFLNEKQIDSDGCYVTKITLSYNREGNMVKGLNKFEFNPQKLYLMYIYDSNYYVDRKIFLPSPVSRNDAKEFILSEQDEVYSIKDIKSKSIKKIVAYSFEEDLGINIHGEIKGNNYNKARLVLNGSKNLREPIVCSQWSFGITDIFFDLEEFQVPIDFTHIDKCYLMKEQLTPENNFIQLDFNLTTKTFMEGWKEHLTFFIIDQDYFFDGSSWEKGILDNNQEDIGAKIQTKKFEIYK